MGRSARGPCGRWHGTYVYDVAQDGVPPLLAVEFELTLAQTTLQRFFGRFHGNVTDARTEVEQGVGTVRGYVRGSSIRFVKRMPVAFGWSKGRSILLSEQLAELGFSGLPERAGPPIYYVGRFEGPDQASGTWVIRGQHLRVARGARVFWAGTTGTWTMLRIE